MMSRKNDIVNLKEKRYDLVSEYAHEAYKLDKSNHRALFLRAYSFHESLKDPQKKRD